MTGKALKDRLLGKALKAVVAVPPLHRFVNRRLINAYAYATGSRPRPFSMAADYTTWPGLTARRFSGRHLACARSYTPAPPPLEDVPAPFHPSADRPPRPPNHLFPLFPPSLTPNFPPPLRTTPTPHN